METPPEPSRAQSTLAQLGATENPQATRVFKLLGKLTANEIERFALTREFQFPFFLEEQQLREMQKEAVEAIGRMPVTETIDFKGTVLYVDSSSRRYDDFEQFFAHAGKRRDPVEIKLEWNRFAISEEGEPITGKIVIGYATEQQNVNEPFEWFGAKTARATLEVSGCNQDWVDQTFEDFKAHIEATKHGGIFRPLWIFRDEITVLVLGIAAAIALVSPILNKLEDQDERPAKAAKIEALEGIRQAARLEEKVDLLAQVTLNPKESPRTKGSVAITILGGVLVFMLVQRFLPKLVPKAAIGIGLARRRAMVTRDTFRFVVGTIFIGGILVPLVMEVIKWLTSK